MEDWIEVGAEVASVARGQHRKVTFSRISRIGKRWLILENGEKFHILGLDRQEGGLVGGVTYRLYQPGNPIVQNVLLDIEARSTMRAALKAAEDFVANPSPENAEVTIKALLPFTTLVLQSPHGDHED